MTMADSFKIKVDAKDLTKQLTALAGKQLPFALSSALNKVGKQAAQDANKGMTSIFDRVSPFTARAVGQSIFASKTSLLTEISIKPLQAKYLSHEILGGTRTPADNTRSTSQALVLPGKGTTPLPSGAVKRIAAQASADQARRAAVAAGARRRGKATGANAGVFKMSDHGPAGGPGGFFKRSPDHHITRLVSFEPQASYEAKYRFRDQILTSVAGNWPKAFEESLARALATAKR